METLRVRSAERVNTRNFVGSEHIPPPIKQSRKRKTKKRTRRKNVNGRLHQMYRRFSYRHLLKAPGKRNNANGLVMKYCSYVIPVEYRLRNEHHAVRLESVVL